VPKGFPGFQSGTKKPLVGRLFSQPCVQLLAIFHRVSGNSVCSLISVYFWVNSFQRNHHAMENYWIFIFGGKIIR
jgi:hypothetical protein